MKYFARQDRCRPVSGGSVRATDPRRARSIRAAVIVISGPGRSGTSFIADLYRNLGFDPGGRWEHDKRAGLEERQVVKMNAALCQALAAPMGPPPRPPLGRQRWDLVAKLADEHGKTLRKLAEQREVVKD